MSVPPKARASSTEAEKTGTEAAQLLSQFKSGNREAGYELLGRQASIDQWKAALRGFASEPAKVDLERIAGSTLGRHPEIVASVIDLLEVVGTSQALLVAEAVVALRDEPHLVQRANEVAQALQGRHPSLLED